MAAPVASGFLVALQAIVLLVPSGRDATVPGISRRPRRMPPRQPRWLPPPEIYELSSTRNIIHIVLDGFPTYTFVDILDADRSTFDRNWSGFTFFPDQSRRLPIHDGRDACDALGRRLS